MLKRFPPHRVLKPKDLTEHLFFIGTFFFNWSIAALYSYVCFCCTAKWISCSVQLLSPVWLCDPMDGSTLGFTVHHLLPELTQTRVRRVDDAIWSSHPLSSPSPPAFNLSQHQGLFQRVSSLHQVAKVLELQLQHQSFQWIFRNLGLTG